MIVLTSTEIKKILTCPENKFLVKVNFGLEKALIEKKENTLKINNIPVNIPQKIKDNMCYLVKNQMLEEITIFSEETNRYYKLLPTTDWPTVCISSVPMHKKSSPKKDTEEKINFLKPKGTILDTCTGLGYTAILSAQRASKVITYEIDENILNIARLNPFSEKLFTSSKIVLKKGDVAEAIYSLNDRYFDCIIHDPPTFKIAPQLYSKKFYEQLWRVLKHKGKLFHYTPLYKITHGYNFPSKIKMNLEKAGFKIIIYSKKVGGILCEK